MTQSKKQRHVVPLVYLVVICVLAIAGYRIAGNAQGFNAFIPPTIFSTTGVTAGAPEQGLIGFHKLIWTGTPASCQVSLDTSTDNVNWSVGGAITAQTCTAAGNSAVLAATANFVRINVSTLTGGTVTVTYQGWTNNPAAGGTANCTTVGGVAFYAASGTAVGCDPTAILASNGTLSLGSAAGNGLTTYNGSTSGSINWGCNAATCTTFQTATPIQTTANSGMAYKHLNQIAANNFAGTCTMAAGTTCTATINLTYTTPICFTNVQSAAPTTFQGSCALSATTVTVTASAANSNVWNFMVMGNPN